MIIHNPVITGSLQVNGSSVTSIEQLDSVSGSVAALNNATSSYALKNSISGSFTSLSSSLSTRLTDDEGSITSLNAASSSYLQNTTDTLTGDLTVTGTITAQEFHTEFVSASIIYESGSTQFGNSSDDTHTFTGTVSISDGTLNLGNDSVASYVNGIGDVLVLDVDSDNDSGGSPNIQFKTGGSEKMRISSDGVLKFTNTASSTGDGGTIAHYTNNFMYIRGGASGLAIGDDGFDSNIYINDNNYINFTTAGTERMRIESAGYIGIGTTNTYAPLQIHANIAELRLSDKDSTSTTNVVAFTSFYHGANTTRVGYIGYGSSTNPVMTIKNEVASGGHITLAAGDSDSMTILDNGNVGIGTTSPGRKLTVTGDASGDANNLLLSNENDTDGDSASIGFSMLSNNTYVKSGIFFERTTTQGRGSLHLAVNNEVNGNNVSKSDAKLTINNSGNVGIGATSPSEKLEVNGTIGSITASYPTIKVQGSDVNYQGRMRWDTNNNVLEFLTRHAGTYYGDTLVLKQGSVGIGDNAPDYRLVVSGTGTERVRVGSTNNTTAGIYFTVKSEGSLVGNGTIATQNNGDMRFFTGTNSESEKMRLLAGGGLTFNGDTAAANALDDYEEGTFTPTVNSGTAGTNWAKYTKIGDLVYVVCELNLTGTRTATTFEVGGLPFTNGGQWTPCAFYCNVYNSEGTQQVTGAFRASTNTFRVINFGNEAIGTDFGGGYFSFAGTYKVN